MKYLLLAGTLGALLLLPIVIANSPNAYANMFLIDNFTDDLITMDCDQKIENTTADVPPGNDPNPTAFDSQMGLTGVFLGVRECQLLATVTNPPSTTETDVAPVAGMFRHMAGSGVLSMAYLEYDGKADGITNANAILTDNILNLDLTQSDAFKIQYSKSEFLVKVNVTMIDGDGDSAQVDRQLDGGVNTLKNLIIPLTAFTDANAGLNLADIDDININFTTTVDATDYDLENIMITMVAVGGKQMPAEMTALLVAGAELNAIWILPAIAAIGIGAFVVSRKRK